MASSKSSCHSSELIEASIDSTDSSSTTTKYGDSDLTSKKRKQLLLLLENNDNDDNNDKFDEMNENEYCIFNKSLLSGEGLNSSFSRDYHCGVVINNANKKNFKDGLVSSSSLSSKLDAAKNIPFVSNTPSGTSCGFENTFRILEKQITVSRNKRMYLRRISEEYVPSLTSLTAESFAFAEENLASNDQEDQEPPSFFELELEAMQRIRDQLQTVPDLISTKTDETDNCGANIDVVTSPINELLYNFSPIGLDNATRTTTTTTTTTIIPTTPTESSSSNLSHKETTIEHEAEYPEYVYHIAKGKDGRKYLRVVRSLLLDRVLCGNRVSQMTRTYDDIEAVTRLLEEKEKDLELTVQIGKELLQQNNRLENRIAELDSELKISNEDRSQLLHDLHKKNELISVLTNDVDDGSENETPTLSKSITLDLLQRKISTLQDENKSLKIEASQLARQTDEVEEQERKLMADITVQLNSANNQYDGVSLELERMKEENRLQHEQIVSLTARLAEAEMRLHQLTTENDEQVSLLSITKENQNMLTTELAEFKTRYQEVLALLQEAQEQLRKYRKKTQPHARSSFIPGVLGMPQPESLHTELMESSIYSENSLDSGISTDRMSSGVGHIIPPYKKVFETVRCAAKNGHYSDGMSHLGAMALSSTSQPRMSAMPFLSTGLNAPGGSYHRPSSVYSGSTYPSYESSMGVKTMSCESLTSQSDDGYPTQPTGVPGAPGAKDLEAALKRLTPAEVLVRRAMLSHAPAGTYTYDESQPNMPLGIRTPDSIMSTGSHSSGILSNISSNQWRLPEKLQIVKPMEGSQTLHHWSRLATPTLSGLLEERPGVKIRGGRGLEDLGLQIYSLSDVEEDIDDYPGKQFQESGCIYTFTNSTVLHPDDGTIGLTFLSQSQLSSRMASNSTSRQPSCPPTPHAGLSRRNSCSTFSVNMGLASMLNERGIKAVTPSAINTPAGPNYSPTVTPCNSPEGSPTRSMSPEPLFGILSSGADLIRRKLMGDVERPTRSQSKQQKILLSRLEKRALRSLRLVEKVESIGLENIIAIHPSVSSQRASGIASRSSSPMAQLSNLRNFATNHESLDDLQFDRDQIRAVLCKGLSNDSLKSLAESDTGISVSSDDSSNDNILSKFLPSSSSSSAQTVCSSSTTKPEAQNNETTAAAATTTNITSTATAVADIRLKQMQRQRSRRHLKNGQRPDLGMVGGGGRVRPDLGKVESKTRVRNVSSSSSLQKQQHQQQRPEEKTTQSMTQSFVGSISSLFFGRKGGWL